MKHFYSWFGFCAITSMKVLSGLIVIKSISYTLGPEIFGQLGQLMTFIAIVSMFSGGGTINGLIQRLSASPNKDKRIVFISAALSIYFVSSTLVTILLLTANKSGLLVKLLGHQNFTGAISVLAFSQWLVGAYNISQALFSGYKKINLLIIVNILGSILGTCLIIGLLIIFGLPGATYGLVLLPACGGIIALFVLFHIKLIDWNTIKLNLRSKEVKTLLSYSFIMLIAASSVPISQLLVRDLIAGNLGWHAVGYWFGIIKVSDVYMQFIGMLLASYAMPIFSSKTNLNSLEEEIKKILIPIVFLAGSALFVFYIFRNYIITIFFSPDFIQMDQLFLPQFVGDYLRIIFSVFIYVFLSRGSRILPVAMELLQGIGLFVFSYALFRRYGLMAPVYAHCLVYAAMLGIVLTAYFLFRLSWFKKNNYENINAMY